MDTNARRIARRIAAETSLALPPGANRLPDNDQWTNRFEIRSETSDRVYTIAQNRKKGHWGCSCPAWRTRRKCKHLKSLGLPELEQPHQVAIASRIAGELDLNRRADQLRRAFGQFSSPPDVAVEGTMIVIDHGSMSIEPADVERRSIRGTATVPGWELSVATPVAGSPGEPDDVSVDPHLASARFEDVAREAIAMWAKDRADFGVTASLVCPACGTQEVVREGDERKCRFCGYWDSAADMSADPAILDEAQPAVIPDDGFADGGEPYTDAEMAVMDRGVVTLEHCSACGRETEHADDGTISRCVKCGEEMPSPD